MIVQDAPNGPFRLKTDIGRCLTLGGFGAVGGRKAQALGTARNPWYRPQSSLQVFVEAGIILGTIPDRDLSTRQYAWLVDEWVTAIGLRREDYGTRSLRRTKEP
jgi:hypothetical protein